VAGTGIVGAMVAKRLAGNRRPAAPRWRTLAHRLLFDAEPGAGSPR